MRFTACLVLVVAGSFSTGCGDDSSVGGSGGSGGNPTGGAPTVGGGGSGGVEQFSCDECAAPNDICVDDASCASTCPAGRSACDGPDTASNPDPERVCCPETQLCCPGVGTTFCTSLPACPLVCPDGTTCAEGSFCEKSPSDDSYTCSNECSPERACGTSCCPLGTRCEDGQCPLPDLSIDEPYLVESMEVSLRDFSENACVIQEGCVAAPGVRKLLRFSLKTPNTGAGDLFLGDPSGNELFEFSTCHEHFHFQGYAQYRLLDQDGRLAATGHKQAFCLLDFEPLGPDSGEDIYKCNYQGIQAGWSDIYNKDLPCQWVDITDVPAGEYQLEIQLNFEQTLAESDYTNNSAVFNVTVEPDSCPQGCRPDTNDGCCSIDDSCNHAEDGFCDCGGFYEWDAVDCSSCLGCDKVTTCTGGCTLASDVCCSAGDPCGYANNNVCDCEGMEDWDETDCTSCISSDPECSNVNTCPNGCSSAQSQPQCCGQNDDCGYANDGWCDCSGNTPWDYADCSNCTTSSQACDNIN